MSHAPALTPNEGHVFKVFAKSGLRLYGLTYEDALDHDCFGRKKNEGTKRFEFDKYLAGQALHLACPCGVYGDLASGDVSKRFIRYALLPGRPVSYRRAHDVLRYIDRAKKTIAWRKEHPASADAQWRADYRVMWPRLAIRAGLDYVKGSEYGGPALASRHRASLPTAEELLEAQNEFLRAKANAAANGA